MERKTKKLVVAGLTVLTVSSTLVGCGSNSSSSSNGGVVNLRYMLWDPNEEVGYKQSIAEFEKEHPNIKVTIEEYDWNDYWQKLQTEMAGGTAPDVFWDHITYFPQFAKSGQIMDLTPFIQQDKLDTSQYFPQLLSQYQYQGKTYGLPKDWDTIALVYNKDLLDKAGLPAPDNLTWNPKDGGTFLQYAEKLTIDQNGKHPNDPGFDPNHIKQYGFLSYDSNQSLYYNFIAENGGQIMDKPFGSKFLLDSPQSVSALQFLQDMVFKYHVSPPGSETSQSNANSQLFDSQKVAMMTDGDWDLTGLYSGAKFKVGVSPLPTGPNGRVSVMNGLSDAIYAKTEHPKEAWELVKWLASKQSQDILTKGGYVWPGINDNALSNNFVSAWKAKGIDVKPFLDEAHGTTISFPVTDKWNQANTDIEDQMKLLWLGKISAENAAKAAVKKANADLAGGNSDDGSGMGN